MLFAHLLDIRHLDEADGDVQGRCREAVVALRQRAQLCLPHLQRLPDTFMPLSSLCFGASHHG